MMIKRINKTKTIAADELQFVIINPPFFSLQNILWKNIKNVRISIILIA